MKVRKLAVLLMAVVMMFSATVTVVASNADNGAQLCCHVELGVVGVVPFGGSANVDAGSIEAFGPVNPGCSCHWVYTQCPSCGTILRVRVSWCGCLSR